MNDEISRRRYVPPAGSAATAIERAARSRGHGARACMLALIVCMMPATSAVAACKPADAALAARYASVAESPVSLRLNPDGSFRVYDLPSPAPDVAGCWWREGDRVVFAPGADDGSDGIKRVLPDPLTQADLDAVRGDGIETIAQALDAGLLPAGRAWAHQARKAGEPVRVKMFDPRAGIAVGDAKLTLRLNDGRELDASPGPGDGEYELASLSASAVVTAIGVRFPHRPERTHWLALTDSTKLLYLIEFDALAVGAIPGGPLALTVQADGSLRSDTPDDIHFKRTP